MLNIHPAIVHVPIGLLTLYSVLELLRFKKITSQSYWFYIKAVLVIAGSLGTFLALQTGELIEQEFASKLMETHSFYATLTTTAYGILAGAYLIKWIETDANWQFLKRGVIGKIWTLLLTLQKFIFKSWIIVILTLIAFALLNITGALGGALVHGPNVDPMVSFVYKIFFQK